MNQKYVSKYCFDKAHDIDYFFISSIEFVDKTSFQYQFCFFTLFHHLPWHCTALQWIWQLPLLSFLKTDDFTKKFFVMKRTFIFANLWTHRKPRFFSYVILSYQSFTINVLFFSSKSWKKIVTSFSKLV